MEYDNERRRRIIALESLSRFSDEAMKIINAEEDMKEITNTCCAAGFVLSVDDGMKYLVDLMTVEIELIEEVTNLCEYLNEVGFLAFPVFYSGKRVSLKCKSIINDVIEYDIVVERKK